MSSSWRYNSFLKERRKSDKDTKIISKILIKPLKLIGKSASKAIKKSTKKKKLAKQYNIVCPLCGCEVTSKNFSGVSFNNDKICSDCSIALEKHFGGKADGIVYLDDLRKIVQDYYKK